MSRRNILPARGEKPPKKEAVSREGEQGGPWGLKGPFLLFHLSSADLSQARQTQKRNPLNHSFQSVLSKERTRLPGYNCQVESRGCYLCVTGDDEKLELASLARLARAKRGLPACMAEYLNVLVTVIIAGVVKSFIRIGDGML